MNESIPDEILDRYLNGEAGPRERARVDAWLAADPARRDMLDAMRRDLAGQPHAFDAEVAWRSVRARIDAEPASAERQPAGMVPPGGRTILLRAAAIAVLLLGGWTAWRAMRSAPAVPAATRVSTAAGQRDTVALPDGSTVILAPASQLSVVAFTGAERTVELSGEAFFTVVRDPDRPFRVRSGPARTEVLGTAFAVRSRQPGSVIVAVREGVVSLAGSDTALAIRLGAGQVGRLVDTTPELLGSDSRIWLSWLDGVLEFDGARLTDVAAELSRWFSAPVTLADSSLADRTVTGRFVTSSPDAALDALALTLGIRWARRDSTWVLGSDGRN
jgi:transmembrane sensor